jgi:outer membrane protein assembly factor BamA
MKEFLEDNSKSHFETKRFAGLGTTLKVEKIDNLVIPTKGVRFTAAASFTKNINQDRQFFNFAGDLYVYIPIFKRFVLSIKNGTAGVTGDPEFYQMNYIGGRKLRGYRRERFWGNYEFHNNNELQYLFDMRSFLFNGKAGVLAFADQGRVWLNGESSSLWHYGYGGGILFCPFNKVYISLMYGRSRENSRIFHVDIRRSIK